MMILRWVLFICFVSTSLLASSINRLPFKYEISSHYPGLSSWYKHNDHFFKGSFHINQRDAFGHVTYQYAHLASIRLGALLNEKTSDLTINHFFLSPGISVSLTPKPYQITGYYFQNLKKVSAQFDGFGASIDREESAINSDYLTTLSVFGRYQIDAYKTTLNANFWNLIPSETDHAGQGINIESKTIVMLNKRPHRFGVGNLYYSWKQTPTQSTYFEPSDYLFSFYNQLRQKRFQTTNSFYVSYETSTTIEKTTLYLDVFAYTAWNLLLTKLTIEYPMDYNLGILTQLFYSTGSSGYGARVNVIWKY
tara:strand:+ start:2432 stop:3355 length:924 start_codon:yes stop_codon:yes gene_type:complete